MTTTTHPDHRLQTARTRRMLEDTALGATGGGTLVALQRDLEDADVWHAEVVRPGERLDVRLDVGLQTVAVAPQRVACAA